MNVFSCLVLDMYNASELKTLIFEIQLIEKFYSGMYDRIKSRLFFFVTVGLFSKGFSA